MIALIHPEMNSTWSAWAVFDGHNSSWRSPLRVETSRALKDVASLEFFTTTRATLREIGERLDLMRPVNLAGCLVR